MLVNVPEPVLAMAVEVPMAPAVAMAAAAPLLAIAAVAPVPMSMNDDFRVDGFYALETCAGCNEGPLQFAPDKTTATFGPNRCWQCCRCPAQQLINKPPGSMTYVSATDTWTWVGPGRMIQAGYNNYYSIKSGR